MKAIFEIEWDDNYYKLTENKLYRLVDMDCPVVNCVKVRQLLQPEPKQEWCECNKLRKHNDGICPFCHRAVKDTSPSEVPEDIDMDCDLARKMNYYLPIGKINEILALMRKKGW